jgi:hypothetical protein
MTQVEELEALRADKLANKIDNQQFNSRVASVIREAARKFNDGELEQADYDLTRQKIGEVITIMNSPGRVAVFAAMQGSAWLDQDSYAQGVKLAIEYTFAHNDSLKQDKQAYTDEAKRTFNAGLKEISKMLDQLPLDVRVKAFGAMSEEMTKRVIGSLPPAQQLRIKREIIETHRGS